MVITAAKDPAQIHAKFWSFPDPVRWDNFIFGLKVTAKYILNSVIVSSAVCVLTIIIGSVCAYGFSMYYFRGEKVLFFCVIALMMIPGILTLVPSFIVVRDMRLINTYWGMILPQLSASLVLPIFLFRSFFEDIPKELFESAQIDGANDAHIMAKIIFPLSIPIISTVAVLNILATWNNYIWPLLVVTDENLRTIPLGLAFLEIEQNLVFSPGKIMAAYTIASIPMLICFLAAMKTFLRGMTSGAVKA
jgi:ABC-type glycerol-3-phosphate transport system permease component